LENLVNQKNHSIEIQSVNLPFSISNNIHSSHLLKK
jgi:hypothetical protein